MRNKLLLCGIAAPVVYVFAVVLGGIIRPGYSHLSQAVSELVATGAPNKALLDPMFALYNLLTTAFAVGLFLLARSETTNRRKVVGELGAFFLVVEGICGFMVVFFPQDPGGAPVTFNGTMHIVLSGINSLTTMLTILLIGFWFKSSTRLRRYSLYSFISVGVILVFGGLAAASLASKSSLLGLLERITIGGFIQWLFVIGLVLYSMETTGLARNKYATMH
ncbi:MAG TPA: DUF998 domain-containing protein [Chloroflexia bacterium]|nr:DUF998 domain-containing protein [Chloroflexia bacterium]